MLIYIALYSTIKGIFKALYKKKESIADLKTKELIVSLVNIT